MKISERTIKRLGEIITGDKAIVHVLRMVEEVGGN